MTDIYNNIMLCGNCNKKTIKKEIIRNGFKIRTLDCPNCKKRWYHPLDIQEYEKFNQVKNKIFRVKLRMVGNSFCVSIPREIIEFQELEKELDKLINITLEEPGKLGLFFSKLENFMNKKHNIKGKNAKTN